MHLLKRFFFVYFSVPETSIPLFIYLPKTAFQIDPNAASSGAKINKPLCKFNKLLHNKERTIIYFLLSRFNLLSIIFAAFVYFGKNTESLVTNKTRKKKYTQKVKENELTATVRHLSGIPGTRAALLMNWSDAVDRLRQSASTSWTGFRMCWWLCECLLLFTF